MARSRQKKAHNFSNVMRMFIGYVPPWTADPLGVRELPVNRPHLFARTHCLAYRMQGCVLRQAIQLDLPFLQLRRVCERQRAALSQAGQRCRLLGSGETRRPPMGQGCAWARREVGLPARVEETARGLIAATCLSNRCATAGPICLACRAVPPVRLFFAMLDDVLSYSLWRTDADSLVQSSAHRIPRHRWCSSQVFCARPLRCLRHRNRKLRLVRVRARLTWPAL